MTMEFFYLIVVMLTFLLLPSASASLGSHRKLNRAIGSEAIPGQYIIALDSNIPNSRGFATHILKRAFRNNIIATYDYAMKGFAVKDLPDMLLHFILNMDDVISVSEDAVVKAETVQTDPTWGLDIIDGQADNLYSYAFTGQGVDVYVLDTGIQANHPDLEGRVESCVSTVYVKKENDEKVVNSQTLVSPLCRVRIRSQRARYPCDRNCRFENIRCSQESIFARRQGAQPKW
jgi:subtilisin family serine protease